jgi:glucan phosphoethanolaminetransferase (alkaline phosphatase superfamily)
MTVVSAVLLSLCLLLPTLGNLRLASTWREHYLVIGHYRPQNFTAPFGFCELGIQIIGMIVLWTGYRRHERLAWFVMFVILWCFFFPTYVLGTILDLQTVSFQLSTWIEGIREGYEPSIWAAEEALVFSVMLVALILPIKAFFRRPAKSNAADE